MALITISGYPCSGKSTRANQLKDAFEQQLADLSYNGPVKKVVLVSDDLLNLSRQAYDGKYLYELAPLYSLIIVHVQMGGKKSHSALLSSRQCSAFLRKIQSWSLMD